MKSFLNWAPTPPMGWNSWDCYGTAVTEAQTKANADYMAENLAQHGWQYIVVDIQWYEPDATGWDYRPGAKLEMDANGRLSAGGESVSIGGGWQWIQIAGGLCAWQGSEIWSAYSAGDSAAGGGGEFADSGNERSCGGCCRQVQHVPVEFGYVRGGCEQAGRAGILRFDLRAIRRVGDRFREGGRSFAALSSGGDCGDSPGD